MTDDKKCPDCGENMLRFVVPDVHPSHFDRARELVELVWTLATVDKDKLPAISIVCLTAALLLKRAAVTMRIPQQAVTGLAAWYLSTAHDMIMSRRAEAKQAN